MRLSPFLVISLSIVFVLSISGFQCSPGKSEESIIAFQNLENEWIKQTDSSKVISNNEAEKWISKFWNLREQFNGTPGATKATVKSIEIAETIQDVKAIDTLIHQISIHEDAMADLVKFIPSQSSSDEASIEKWKQISRNSQNEEVQSAAMFQIVLTYSSQGQNLQAAMLLDSLQSKYGINEDHQKYGSQIEEIQQAMASHAIGKKLTDFNTFDINGIHITSNDFNEKVTLLYFHGTGCGACIKMYPKLNRLYHNFKEDNFLLLGIAADGAYYSEERFRRYLRKFNINWSQTLDIDLFEKYKVNFLSTAFLLNKEGVIVRTSRADEVLQSIDGLENKSLEEAIEYLIAS